MANEMIDRSVEIGGQKFRHLIRKPAETEKLDKKWEQVQERPTPSPDEISKMRMLEQRLGEAKENKQKKHDVWNHSYLQYRSVNHLSMMYGGFPTYWNSWGSGVFIPRTFETVESIKVQMMGRKPSFTITPTFPVSSGDGRELNNLLHSEYDRSKTQVEVAETVHDSLVYGAAIIRSDLKNIKKNEYAMSWENGAVKYTPKDVQKYYGVGARRVDPYDWYPNPSVEAYRRDKLGWGFERAVVDAWDLREQYRLLKEAGAIGVTDNWEYLKPGGDVANYKYIRQEIDSLYSGRSEVRYPGNVNDLFGGDTQITTHQTGDKTGGKIEVWEYWEDDRLIVVANGLILRDCPNPYPHKKIPYIKFNCIDMNEYWGMGVPEYMRWLQMAENVLYDQGLNNIIMTVHKMFAVNSRYLEDEGELVARPFGIIHTKQIPGVKISDAVMPIEYSHQMGNYFEFMRMNTQNIQTVTGVSPYQTGGVTKESKVERATVANRLTFAGSARIREIARHLEDSLVADLIEDYIAIVQFYYRNLSPLKDGLPVEIDRPGKSNYILFLPSEDGKISDEARLAAISAGYVGVIAQSQIQGRFKVVVQGGSIMPTDPDEKARLKLEFFKMASAAVEMVDQPGTDPKTGAPTMMQVPKPIFNVRKIAEEVAREVFEIADPEEYVIQPEQPATPGGGEVDVNVPPVDQLPGANLPPGVPGGTI